MIPVTRPLKEEVVLLLKLVAPPLRGLQFEVCQLQVLLIPRLIRISFSYELNKFRPPELHRSGSLLEFLIERPQSGFVCHADFATLGPPTVCRLTEFFLNRTIRADPPPQDSHTLPSLIGLLNSGELVNVVAGTFVGVFIHRPVQFGESAEHCNLRLFGLQFERPWNSHIFSLFVFSRLEHQETSSVGSLLFSIHLKVLFRHLRHFHLRISPLDSIL
mmetsp:Transcript_10200/g.20916  ORF Transcript_10200/g.20916 Transcript_10200/m.20916 type:complete len:217 (-) Transcript_10200:726-1376(-)